MFIVKPDLVSQRKTGLLSLREALRAVREGLGVTEPGKGEEEEECSQFNTRMQPVSGQWDEAEEEDNVSWTDVRSCPRYVIGTDVCEDKTNLLCVGTTPSPTPSPHIITPTPSPHPHHHHTITTHYHTHTITTPIPSPPHTTPSPHPHHRHSTWHLTPATGYLSLFTMAS